MSERRLAIGDLEVAVDCCGSGAPVVLVHGGLGSRKLWAPQVAALRPSYRVIAYDLRGHGETRGATRPRSYGPRLLARDLERLLDALGLARASVVGLSVGGLVAQELALGRPERVAALVLADTWVKTGMRRSERLLGRALSPFVIAGLTVLGTGPLGRVTGTHLEPELGYERDLMVRAVIDTDRRDAVRIWRGLAEQDTLSRLAQIGAPTLIIAGDRDRNVEQARLMHRLIPGSELSVIPGAGHVSNLHRAELFNASLRAFLDRVHGLATCSPPSGAG